MSRSSVLTVLLASSLLLAVTGCAGDTTPSNDSDASRKPTSAAASPEATPSASPSPTAVATTTADAPPELAALVVTVTGIAPLTVGEPVPSPPDSHSLATYDPSFCVREGRPVGDPWAGAWRPSYPTETVDWAPRPVDAFTVYTEDRSKDDVIGSLIVWSPQLATAAGIHPGSTREELELAYPSSATVTEGLMTSIYVVRDPAAGTGELWFEVAKANYAPDIFPSSIVDTVLWIAVMPGGNAPYSLTETDSGGGPCVP
jgi:hypothetical protein